MRVHLTAEFVRSILDYAPDTGIFRWRHRADRKRNWNSRYAGTVAGQTSSGYRAIQIDGKGAYPAARIAWLYVTGEWPPDQIDHINSVRDDDRFDNLRAATNAENSQNRGPQRNNRSSGLRGVHFHAQSGKWRARIKFDGCHYSLGLHDKPEEAAAARDAFVAKHLGAFGRPSSSFPTSYPPRVRSQPVCDRG